MPKSQFTGVSWKKGRNKWRARIVIQGKTKELGEFPPTPEGEVAAAQAYDAALEQRNAQHLSVYHYEPNF